MRVIEVTAVPAFSDNYIWLITAGGNSCAVVDPGDAQPVLEVLREKGLDLDYILITHHHPDHIGGMRRRQASVVSAAQKRKPSVQAGAGTLAVIRAWKDGF
jgi:glyoxylase-like metal-dependent hydrolase (beta-lactamase superfamily II)